MKQNNQAVVLTKLPSHDANDGTLYIIFPLQLCQGHFFTYGNFLRLTNSTTIQTNAKCPTGSGSLSLGPSSIVCLLKCITIKHNMHMPYHDIIGSVRTRGWCGGWNSWNLFNHTAWITQGRCWLTWTLHPSCSFWFLRFFHALF